MTPVRLLRATGDDALARRASRGDEEAFGVLFSRYQLRLELYCRSILRHDEDARDAAQSAMTKAWLALRGREQDLAVRAWLFRIAHNESISLMRRRRPTTELTEVVGGVQDGGGAAAPAEAVELREELAAVLDGIRELPDRARQALLLRELADLDYASVATILGITPGGARQAVFEARSALQADRAGRDEACSEIRRELSAHDHRRRPTRKARGHLRGCSSCRTWTQAQDTRREHLSLLPGAGIGAAGSLWAWLAGVTGGVSGGGATISTGGLAVNGKLVAGALAIAAGTAPVAVHEVQRELHRDGGATRTTTVVAQASAASTRTVTVPAASAASAVPAPTTASTRTTFATTGGARAADGTAADSVAADAADRELARRALDGSRRRTAAGYRDGGATDDALGDGTRPWARRPAARRTDEGGPRPADGAGARPGDGAGARPGDGAGARPVDGAGPRPVDGSGAQPADGSGAQPVDGSGARPGDGSGPRPTDGSGAGPRPGPGADGTPYAPADGGTRFPRPADGGGAAGDASAP